MTQSNRSIAALVLGGTLLAIASVGGSLVAQPGNDSFADAVALSGVAGQVYGSNLLATREPGEPAHAGGAFGRTAWWRWTAPQPGRLTVFTHGSGFDTLLALYSGEVLADLTELGSSDDTGDGSQSLVVVDVGAGAVVHIAVDGREQAGKVVLTWYLGPQETAPPANDFFADRPEILGAWGQLIATNDAATRQPDEPFHGGNAGGRSVWWRWTPPASGHAVVHTGGSTFDTVLAVYRGEALDQLWNVSGNDGHGVTSYTFFPVAAGVEYQIAVDGGWSASGIIVLYWEFLRDCQPPPAPASPFPPQGAAGVGESVTLEWGRPAALRQPVIYGDDDRLELYEVEDPALLRVADSTLALVFLEDLVDNGDGTYSLPAERLRENRDLCEDERFANQPNPAWCSGFLVGPDLVATAGHCLTTTTDCASFAFVFGFRMQGPGEPVLTFSESQVYFCDEIRGRELNLEYDWTLARLDRPVLDRAPLPLRRDGQVQDEQSLVVIGHPTGWPAKVAAGARVRDNSHSAYFTANLDTYGGSSGSPVLNAETLLVEGLLVSGEDDFLPDGDCLRSKVCDDDGCSGEQATRSSQFAPLVAATDSLPTYEVHFGLCDDGTQVVAEVRQNEWTASGLDADQAYCWQIVARRPCGETWGPLWSFRTAPPAVEFVRGDADADGSRNLTDAVVIVESLFAGRPRIACGSAADVNDDGVVNVADPVALLLHLFSSARIEPPLECGSDPTPDELTCEATGRCG